MILHKIVDWTTIKVVPSITMLMERDISRQQTYPGFGLRRKLKVKPSETEYQIDESNLDSDLNNTREYRASRRAGTQAIGMEADLVLLNMNEHLDENEHLDPIDNIGGVQVRMDVIMDEDNIVERQPVVAKIRSTIVEGVPISKRGD